MFTIQLLIFTIVLELLTLSIVLEDVQDASLLGSVSIALFKTYVTCTCSCAQQNADLRSLTPYITTIEIIFSWAASKFFYLLHVQWRAAGLRPASEDWSLL